MLKEQIVKMDCEHCQLRTEHYLVDYGERGVLCRCMKCGHVTRNPGSSSQIREPYPIDTRRPFYVA